MKKKINVHWSVMIILIIFLLAIWALVPVGAIFAWNVLFGAFYTIPINLLTWLAGFILIGVLRTVFNRG